MIERSRNGSSAGLGGRAKSAIAAAVAAASLAAGFAAGGAYAANGNGGGGGGGGHHNHGGNKPPQANKPPAQPALPQEPFNPLQPVFEKADHIIPKAPGTKETIRLWYGPYAMPSGWDMNRVDLELPVAPGMILSVDPSLHMALDGSEPSHQVAHIHHAHWFSLNPGTKNSNYLPGIADWMFGNGDEETKANYQQRSAAEPGGPIYGNYLDASEPQPMIYMLHNKTSGPMLAWIRLNVTFIHGTMQQLNDLEGREYHDITGVLFGRTFDVPRNRKSRDGTYETAEDDKRGVIEWTATMDGTMIGTGSHVHPGGLGMTVENYGSPEDPCPDDGQGYGGTLLLDSDVIWRHGVRYTEDYQTEVTNPAWRAPIHEGDRIRISSYYANKKTAWYTAMAHEGLYVDEGQPPEGRCKPYLVGKAAKQEGVSITDGVRNRPWGGHSHDKICGQRYGELPCERPAKPYSPGVRTNDVAIANFQYLPGDLAASGQQGQPVQVPQGESLRFFNVDQVLNIRHSVTTCPWPCNGPYTANYPHADGVWDSGTLGYDLVDGGSPDPAAATPPDLPVGKYSYFCRIHPFMRGAFEVTKN